MQHSGVEELAASMFLDSTSFHRGYSAKIQYLPALAYQGSLLGIALLNPAYGPKYAAPGIRYANP